MYIFGAVLLLLQLGPAAAAKSAGCGKSVNSTLDSGDADKSNTVDFTTSDGDSRTYLLHIPSNYDKDTATPLMFSFHGRGEDGEAQEGKTSFSNETVNPDMMVVYPDGKHNEWQGDPDASGVDDVSFVLDMIAALEDEFCIDTERIYSSGFSNGAGFSTNILACNSTANSKIAAFMGASAAVYLGDKDASCDAATIAITCDPGRTNIPILETHGSADDTIEYWGGERRSHCLPTMPHFMTEWATRNLLDSTNITTALFDDKVKLYHFGDGLVIHYWVHHMGHEWPTVDDGNYFDASPVVLDFFNNHTLSEASASASSTSSTASATATSTASKTSGTAAATSKSSADSLRFQSTGKPIQAWGLFWALLGVFTALR